LSSHQQKEYDGRRAERCGSSFDWLESSLPARLRFDLGMMFVTLSAADTALQARMPGRRTTARSLLLCSYKVKVYIQAVPLRFRASPCLAYSLARLLFCPVVVSFRWLRSQAPKNEGRALDRQRNKKSLVFSTKDLTMDGKTTAWPQKTHISTIVDNKIQ